MGRDSDPEKSWSPKGSERRDVMGGKEGETGRDSALEGIRD